MFGPTSRTPRATAAGRKVAADALQAARDWLLGEDPGTEIESGLDFATENEASTAGYDMRQALASLGIWVSAPVYPAPNERPDGYEGPFGFRLTVVERDRFRDKQGTFADVPSATVPDGFVSGFGALRAEAAAAEAAASEEDQAEAEAAED